MADLYEPDYGTAFYRSRDAIKNLKIKINLERVTSASIVPQAEIEEEAAGDVEMRNMKMHQNFGGQKDIESYTFKWQEKVFSQREMNMYSDGAQCQTVLERKYHEDTNKLRETGRPTKRLFTYVEHDSFTNADEVVRKMTTSPNEEPSIMAEKMSGMRHRRVANRDKQVIPKMNVVDYEPSEELVKQNHLMSTPVQTMYIMADLTPSTREASAEDEFVICTIKVDYNGVVSIKPDFNKGCRPYKIEAPGMGRDLFEYTIEHASSQLNRQEQERENKMLKELYNRHSEFLQACVGHEFEMPPLDMLRQLVYGEIETARDFEYGDLYIQYFVDLPDGWLPNGMQQLSGVTHTCSTKVEGRDNVAHFSFPIDFELLYKRSVIDEKGQEERLPKWPQLFLEVLSIDSWQRYRTEGYGYMTLPCKPGMHNIMVHCWRPVGNSCVSEMRRFFVGGNPEVEDPTYAAVPSTFEGRNLSKFGFRTLSTGSVTLKLNIIQQSQSFMQSASSKKKVGSLMDRIGQSAAQANILNVLEAFQRAKERMVNARENLKKDYIETLKAFGPEEEEDAE